MNTYNVSVFRASRVSAPRFGHVVLSRTARPDNHPMHLLRLGPLVVLVTPYGG